MKPGDLSEFVKTSSGRYRDARKKDYMGLGASTLMGGLAGGSVGFSSAKHLFRKATGKKRLAGEMSMAGLGAIGGAATGSKLFKTVNKALRDTGI